MKKLTVVTTALAIAIIAPTYFAAQPARADECVYPSDFVEELNFESLADYAIYGDTRAYADDTRLYIISPDKYGDEYLNEVSCQYKITDLEYGDDGTLYLNTTSGVFSYSPSDTRLQSAQFDFENLTRIQTDEYLYALNAQTGALTGLDNLNEYTTIFEEGCSQLKEYDGSVYVINDGSVYMLDGTQPVEQPARYTDFSSSYHISTGDAADILAGGYEVRTVTIRSQTSDGGDTYYTKINLENIGETFDAQGTERLAGDRSALAIAEVGNATIVVMPDENGMSQSYITLTSAVENSEYTPPALDMTGAYARTRLTIYSRPYMCGATAIATVESGTVFTVSEKFNLQYLDGVYYRVTCTVDGEEISGFVINNLLSPYSFSSENQPEDSTGSEGFIYDNDVQTVIIVLLIILLALIAVGYVTFYLTRKNERAGRRRKPRRPDDDLYS